MEGHGDHQEGTENNGDQFYFIESVDFHVDRVRALVYWDPQIQVYLSLGDAFL